MSYAKCLKNEETAILEKYLIEESKTFDENKNNMLRIRGIRTAIKDYETYDELLDLFRKDSFDNYEVTWLSMDNSIHRWTKSFASNRLRGNYISPYNLEPFIARYIIALNEIGIKTFNSCDGWHKRKCGTLFVGFRDRNSMVWHRIITELLNIKSIEWEYTDILAILNLPSSESGRLQTYLRLNQIAALLEQHQEELLALKKNTILKVKGQRKNNLSNEELYEYLMKNI